MNSKLILAFACLSTTNTHCAEPKKHPIAKSESGTLQQHLQKLKHEEGKVINIHDNCLDILRYLKPPNTPNTVKSDLLMCKKYLELTVQISHEAPQKKLIKLETIAQALLTQLNTNEQERSSEDD